MYLRDLSSSEGYNYSGTASVCDRYNTDANRGPSPPPAPRRRSHRPRGCRGGRKNKKNKAVSTTVFGPGMLHTDAPLLQQRQNFQQNNHKEKDDMSPYHHVNTNKAWEFGSSQIVHDAAQKQQMLPPPVPSALFESSRFFMESNGGCLKMLPSFEEAESLAESFIPPSMEDSIMHAPTHFALDSVFFRNSHEEATVDTASSSGDESDNSWCNHGDNYRRIELQRQQELESGSLFVTSPRSFLLGEARNNSNQGNNNNISVW